jgi:hypothetical protein
LAKRYEDLHTEIYPDAAAPYTSAVEMIARTEKAAKTGFLTAAGAPPAVGQYNLFEVIGEKPVPPVDTADNSKGSISWDGVRFHNPDLLDNVHYVPPSERVHFKYGEDMYLAEATKAIEKTYSGHYVGAEGIQSFDLIKASGNGLGFTVGNIMKYAARFGKKEGFNRDDMIKVIHYAVMALHVLDTGDGR